MSDTYKIAKHMKKMSIYWQLRTPTKIWKKYNRNHRKLKHPNILKFFTETNDPRNAK